MVHDHHAHHKGTSSEHEHHNHHSHHAQMVADYRKRFWISLGLTLPILVLSPMLQAWLGITGMLAFSGDVWVLWGLSTLIYGYGGWPFLKGFVQEMQDRSPGMMTLVALAVSVAYIYSTAVVFGLDGKLFFWETATLIDLMLVGHWVEMRSVMGASRALEELARLMPKEAHRIREDGSTEDVPLSDLNPGDHIRIKSGEKIPADGDVVEGTSSVNESMLTGESKPVAKETGNSVIAGSVNGKGMLVVTVQKTGGDSYLNQVIGLVREAQATKSKTQDLANRAARYLTLAAVTGGVLTFAVWFFIVGNDLTFSLERMVTVMVIACPHALGLAIPLVVAVSTSLAAGRGLLIRDRAAFERARLVDTIVFDKTGTLTKGQFGVSDLQAFEDYSSDTVLELAAAVEQHSEHPLAAGIVRSAEDQALSVLKATDFEALPGRGVQARVEGHTIQVLSPKAVEDRAASLPDHPVAAWHEQGKTVVYVVRDEAVIGVLALADQIREVSAEAIERLHTMGIESIMLTGDNHQVATWVAEEVGIDEVIAEVLPDEKSQTIKKLQQKGRIVAMTGDGVNDAPALANADVGLAIGAGTDVAAETADVILVDSDPRDAVAVIQLARATYQKMVQNLWYAAGYNIIAIPLAAGALASLGIVLSPAVGAVLMSLSTVVVAINARQLRLPTD